MESLFVTVCLFGIAFLCRAALIDYWRFPTAGGAVVINSLLYLIGAWILAIEKNQTEILHLVYFNAAFSGIYVTVLCALRPRIYFQPTSLAIATRGPAVALLWLFFLAMSLVVFVLAIEIGLVSIVVGLLASAGASAPESSVPELRAKLSGAEGIYFAPGYIKQIRDVMLPLAGLLLMFCIRRGVVATVVIRSLIVVIVVLGMTTSGERGPLVLFAVACVVLLRQEWLRSRRARQVGLISQVGVVTLASGLFIALTASFDTRDYGGQSPMLIFLDRIFVRMPDENLKSRELWVEGAEFPGAGWLSELATILPAYKSTYTLSREAARQLYGGDVGNSVLGLWVDVFYNFGFIGGCVMAAILAVILARLDIWFYGVGQRSLPARVCASWFGITMLMVLSPYGFLLYGPFVIFFAALYLDLRNKKRPWGSDVYQSPR